MKNIINCRVDFIYIWQEIIFAKRQFETSQHANFDTKIMVTQKCPYFCIRNL